MQALIHDLEAMGTVFRFTFAKADQAQVLAQLPTATRLIQEADSTFSTYRPDSEVSLINAGQQQKATSSEDVRNISEACRIWNLKTQGGFDSTNRLGQWDPSGIVKAWAAQSAVQYLEAQGIKNFSLNAGGDVLLGSEAQLELQRVGLAKPKSIAKTGFQAAEILDLSDTGYHAVATSGTVERGAHIWGEGNGLIQVSVIGEDLISADVWATAIFAKGPRLLEVLEAQGLQATITFANGRKITTRGFGKLLAQETLKIGA